MSTGTRVDFVRVAAVLTRLLRIVDRRVRCELGEEMGLSELALMDQIYKGVYLPSALARSLKLDPARVTRSVDQLVRLGYLERGTDDDDRRRCPLRLTTRGRNRLAEGHEVVGLSMRTVLTQLDAGVRERVLTSLDDVTEALASLR